MAGGLAARHRGSCPDQCLVQMLTELGALGVRQPTAGYLTRARSQPPTRALRLLTRAHDPGNAAKMGRQHHPAGPLLQPPRGGVWGRRRGWEPAGGCAGMPSGGGAGRRLSW